MIPSPELVWFLIGVAFLIAELLVPGFILIFFAAGSWIAALLVWATGMALSSQVLVFLAASLVLLFSLRRLRIKTFTGAQSGTLDDDYARDKTGRQAVVTQTIQPNVPGEIKLMGSFWRAVADSTIEEGQAVIVEGPASPDGLTLRVRPL